MRQSVFSDAKTNVTALASYVRFIWVSNTASASVGTTLFLNLSLRLSGIIGLLRFASM